MSKPNTSYGLSVSVPIPYEEAVEKTREELAKEAFGVLTEIDVRATFKKKLDVEFRPYVILGACNPPLAHQALSTELGVGVLLPCNVVVYQGEDPGSAVVTALDPVEQLKIAGKRELEGLAREVRARMERVLEGVAA
jgi:uncharacterized protein (DUF302 family)